jgi:hypothetical protein
MLGVIDNIPVTHWGFAYHPWENYVLLAALTFALTFNFQAPSAIPLFHALYHQSQYQKTCLINSFFVERKYKTEHPLSRAYEFSIYRVRFRTLKQAYFYQIFFDGVFLN